MYYNIKNAISWGLPIKNTIIFWLLIDRIQPSEFWWGVFYTYMVIMWVVNFYGMAKQVNVKIVELSSGNIYLKKLID